MSKDMVRLEFIRALRAHLVALWAGEVFIPNPRMGICALVEEFTCSFSSEKAVDDSTGLEAYLRAIGDSVLDASFKWPKYSGQPLYPVPHPVLSPKMAFYGADLWGISTYAHNRRELCLWLADWITENLLMGHKA